MDPSYVPSAIATVVEPLREADEYARLQLQRQRGVYNILTGLPGFLLVVPPFVLILVFLAMFGRMVSGGEFVTDDLLSISPLGGFVIAFQLVSWTLFILSCFTPRLLLPFIRRRRPDWESVLLRSSLMKDALEKQFWLQFPFFYVPTAILPLFTIVIPLLLGSSLGVLEERLLTLGILAAFHVMAMVLLARQSAKGGDRVLAKTYRVSTLLALPFFLLPTGLAQVTWAAILTFQLALVVPSVALGIFRLVAPRRWLVQ